MKNHLTKILCVLLIVSVFVNIFAISSNRRQQREMERIDSQLIQNINNAIHRTVFTLRGFIENNEKETLIYVADNLTLLESIISTRGELRNVPVSPFVRFSTMGDFLVSGGWVNGRYIDAIFDDGIVDENELNSLIYLEYALWNILFVPSTAIPTQNSITAFNERFSDFVRFLFGSEPQRYNLF
jgi:hypothetical protein